MTRSRSPVARGVAIATLALALIAFPLGTLASHQFNDVPDSNPFHADIDAIADAGVTTGCGGGNYCPSAYVTREQMAAFMNRLGALGPGKTPVANATTVDSYSANQINRMAFNTTSSLESAAATTASLHAFLQAPRAGWLFIAGSAEMIAVSDDYIDGVVCRLYVDSVQVPGAEMTQDIWRDTDLSALYSVNADQATCSPVGGRVVCLTGSLDVELRISSIGSGTNIGNANVVAEFMPFDETGLPPLCVI